MATLEDALKLTRVYLNDQGASTWTDALLIGFAQVAYKELLLRHELATTQELIATSAPVTIPVGTKSMAIANMRNPVTLYEKYTGENDDAYVEMVEREFLPNDVPQDRMLYWSWQNDSLVFLGSTREVVVKVDYYKTLGTPTVLTETLGIQFAELYVGARAAALASMSVGNNRTAMSNDKVANDALDTIVSHAVKSRNLVKKRIPFRRRGVRVVR